MMANRSQTGYEALGRQASLILAVAALAWCAATGVGMLEALFRAAVVYLLASIIILWLRGVLARLVSSATEEQARALKSESTQAEGEAGNQGGEAEE